MKTHTLFVLALLSAGIASAAPTATPTDPAVAAAGIGQKVAAFTADTIVLSGDAQKTEPWDSQKTKHMTAYVIVGTHCPTTAAYADRFRDLQSAYAKKGVDFVFVYPNRDDPSDAKLAFHKEHQFGGRLIDDQGGRVARLLGAARTSEIILVDKKGTIVFRGALDDSKDPAAVQKRYVSTALDEQLAGKPVTTPVSQVFA